MALVRWISVISTMISAVAYDSANEVLGVEFKSGKRYRYFGVEADVYDEFLAADSKGRFFQAEIQNCYPFERIK